MLSTKDISSTLNNIHTLTMRLLFSILSIIICFQTNAQKVKDGFVLIPEMTYFFQHENQKDSIHVKAFQICDHPVTNLEYNLFITATGYPKPLHWVNGSIPEGKEEYPVIYVNRDDVDAYLSWLIKTSGKSYRLPSSREFEVAAFNGQKKGKYYWGDDNKKLTTDLINFDAEGNRAFEQWEKYLKPARWGMRNDAGLYQMAGNVWQLMSDNYDPAISTYKYRIETLSSCERVIMGGSWTSTRDYFPCGKTFGQSPGKRER